MILLLIPIAAAIFGPFYIKKIQHERDRLRQADQLRESLQILVSALRTGTGLMQALEYAANECPAPMCGHWRQVLSSVRLGESWNDALEALAQRVAIKEMRWFVASVQITQSSGGSLAEVLETLSNALQAQQTLRDKVSALTAQGKASGIILSCLPFVIMAGLAIVAPEFAKPMYTTAQGQLLLTAIMFLLAIGGAVIKNIVTIRVD